MKRNHSRSKAALAAILGMAGLGMAGQLAQASQPKESSVQYQATPDEKKTKNQIINGILGGMGVLPPTYGQYGMSPKEYGIRFGTGKSRNKKSNRLRYSANAKIRRRLSC